jgi:hypothetical protein
MPFNHHGKKASKGSWLGCDPFQKADLIMVEPVGLFARLPEKIKSEIFHF